jgi:hypothetical protein
MCSEFGERDEVMFDKFVLAELCAVVDESFADFVVVVVVVDTDIEALDTRGIAKIFHYKNLKKKSMKKSYLLLWFR